MRLCYLANPNSVHTRRWLTHFVEQGHEVHLITHYRNINLEGVEIHYAPLYSSPILRKFNAGRVWGLLPATLDTKKVIKTIKPDILHAHYAVWYSWVGALSNFHPFVVTLWGGDIAPERGAFDFPRNWWTPFSLRKADLITSFSKIPLKTAKQYTKFKAEEHIIRLGADLDHFKPSKEINLWRKRLGLVDRPIIFSPRSWAPIYNLETIVQAIPDILEDIPDACFVFKDNPPLPNNQGYRTKIQQLIRDIGVEKAIRYVGEVDYNEMANIYGMADIVVSVTLSEGFPVSLFEAMACGVPLVLGKIPQLEELLTDKQNTLFVSPQEPKQLAKAIIRLLNDGHLQQQIMTNNLALVKEAGDFYAEMKKMEHLYEKMLVHQSLHLS